MANRYIPGTNPRKEKDRYSYKDYKTWGEEERWELIKGVPYAMSPSPQRRHQALVVQFISQLDTFFRGKPCRPLTVPVDVFFPEGEEDLDSIKTIVQPDILVVCDPSKLIEEGVRGAPDFIVEILSPATALKDQSEKKELYEKKGVREYWVVNPHTLETFVYLLQDGSYGLPRAYSLRASVDVTIFPGLALRAREEEL